MPFKNGTFLQVCKISNIISIYAKRKDTRLLKIHNLSLNKCWKTNAAQCMHHRLFRFLNESNCLYIEQLGFRNIHSTNQALVNIIEETRRSLYYDEFTCGIP